MNDLEHDLRQLFEQQASSIDTPGLPPKGVLQRGRRRQVGTVVTGVMACIVALGIAAAAIGQARHPAVIPGEGNGLPERTTSIGGVPVTAPAGWTLVDDWPLAALLPATSQECSFAATGAAVSGNGSPIESTPTGEGGEQPGNSCTQTPVNYAAGFPVLQLANFEIPVMKTVCGLADQEAPASLPADGVAVYVGMFPANAKPFADPASCPNAADPGQVAIAHLQGLSDSILAATVISGSDARGADVATATDYVRTLDGITVDYRPPAAEGPGYVMAAGENGGVSWRLEAAITAFDRQDGSPTIGAVMSTTTASDAGSRSVELPSDRRVNDDYVDLGEHDVVQFGTASANVTAIDVMDPNGSTVPATLFSWPAELASLPALEAGPSGRLWFAETSGRGEVRATTPTTPTAAPTGATLASPERLHTTTEADGNYVISGNDFGHDWSFTQDRNDGSLMFSLDGATPTEGYSFTRGSGTSIDIDGGTLQLNLEPASVENVWVTSDVDGKNILAEGRVAPPAGYAPSRANIWIVALPGSGAGYSWSTDRELPLATSWPTAPETTPGKVFTAGISDGISFTQTWSEAGCPTLEIVASTATGDTGSAGCPVAWNAREYPHSVSYVGGVYGQHHAVVLMTGPENMCADVHAPGDPQAGPFCSSSVAGAAPWSSTGESIFVIPVGETWTIQPTQKDGSPFGSPITITARPGSIVTGDTPSPAP